MSQSLKHITELSPREYLVSFAASVASVVNFVTSELAATADSANEADAFACRLLLENIKKKQSNLYGEKRLSDAELEEITLKGFLDQERKNAMFNRTATFGYDCYTGEFTSDFIGDKLLYIARDHIHKILGAYDERYVIEHSSFGNGASTLLPRAKARDWQKSLATCQGTASVTSGCAVIAQKAIAGSHIWSDFCSHDDKMIADSTGVFFNYQLKTVCGAVYDTVEKTASIKRVILKEPELNGFIQKGIGALIRSKLKLAGVDLNHSGFINSSAAREGSVHGYLATVDAERASDSITLALCEFLLPSDWYKALCDARSPYVLIKGKGLLKLDMMSGMGNGFTFELESLIFYAIGLACAKFSKVPFAEQHVSIHGDDLIIPSDCFGLLIEAYNSAGIVVNTTKSYVEGPFRESCGGNWFRGYNVTPFYVKGQCGSTRGDWFWLYNSFLIWYLYRTGNFQRRNRKAVRRILHNIAMIGTAGQLDSWFVPPSYGRRTGLYCDYFPTKKNSYKGRLVVTRGRHVKTDDLGMYIVSMNMPKTSPSVFCVLFENRKPQVTYGSTEDVVERDGYHRFTWWDSFHSVGLPSPLWRVI